MPIHNLGYREWDGQRESGRSRWLVIAGIGIRRAWQSKWLRRIAFVVWGPPLVYGIMIFMFEQFLNNRTPIPPQAFQQILKIALPEQAGYTLASAFDNLQTMSAQDLLEHTRPMFWKSVLLQLQRSQCVGMVIVVGLIAPPLISQDVRSRAFLLYFSRPLTRFQYIGGKFATVASFLLLTCTLPQLLLYLFAVLLSPDISVVAFTWDLPVRAMAASAVMIVPTTMLALMLSSLTTETRFATFGWFTIWIFGMAAYAVMQGLQGEASELILRVSYLYLLYSDLAAYILGLESPLLTPHADTQFAVVIAMTVICFAVIFRKVSAPLRA